MRLTAHELHGHAELIDDSLFPLNSCPFPSAPGLILLGFYELPRRSGEAHLHRLNHPLAEAIVAKAKGRELPVQEVRFDYGDHDGIISILEPLVGKSGLLTLSAFTVESLDQAEDHLIFGAVTDEGNPLDDECAARLFTLPGMVAGPCLRIAPNTAEATIQRRQAAIQLTVSERNARLFEAEAEKLDGWADDLKVGLERELKEIDRQIKEARRAATTALTLEEKLAGQKQIKALESHRNEKRRSLFEAQDEVDQQREQLIANIEGKLEQHISLITLSGYALDSPWPTFWTTGCAAQEGQSQDAAVRGMMCIPRLPFSRFVGILTDLCYKFSMYIHKITLTNIRGFRSLDFDLQRPDKSYAGWTVFTGDNGSGKSTLLKAIAMGLVGPDTRRPLQPSLHRWVSASSAEKKGTIQLQIKCTPDDADLDGQGRSPANIFPVTLELVNGGKQTEMHSPQPATGKQRKSSPERTIWSPSNTGWFSCGYGPFRRVFGASAEATEIMVERSTARYATMFLEAASLSPADRWLKDLDHKAAKDGHSREREELNLLLELLKDELMPNGMIIKRVDADGLWLADRNGVELSWGEMSDGYRAALALLTDIIRHLSYAHEDNGLKSLLGRDDKGRLFVKSTGVVLIDEIDAHLHPEWQREIGFWLKRHFPNIQFLVTTHSPIICQAADPGGLFVLPEPGSGREPCRLSDEERDKIIASRPDTILLSPAFGLQNTRSPVAVEARAEYARMEGKKRSTGKLSQSEQDRCKQLLLFVNTGEDL